MALPSMYRRVLHVLDETHLFMPSLATNTTYVQQRLAQYANDLLSLGVDGFRLDAAKSGR